MAGCYHINFAFKICGKCTCTLKELLFELRPKNKILPAISTKQYIIISYHYIMLRFGHSNKACNVIYTRTYLRNRHLARRE